MILNVTAQNENGEPIAGALLSFITAGGAKYNFSSGANGRFEMIVTDDFPGMPNADTTVQVTAAGYKTVTNPDLSADITIIRMEKSFSPLWMGAGLLAVVAIASTTKKKKVKGFDFEKIKPWLIPVGVVVAGYVVLNYFFGQSPEDKAYQEALDQGISDAEAQKPSYLTDAELAVMANTLDEDLHYSWDVNNNQTDALAQFERITTLGELLKLIKFFGTRQTYVFGIPKGGDTLQQMVKASMSADNINLINQYFANAGIAFQF